MSLDVIPLIREKKLSKASQRVFKEFSSLTPEAIEAYAKYLIEEDLEVSGDYAKKEITYLYQALVRRELKLPTPGFYNGESIDFSSDSEKETNNEPDNLNIDSFSLDADSLEPKSAPEIPEIKESNDEIISFSLEQEKQEQEQETEPEPIVEPEPVATLVEEKSITNLDFDFSTSFDDFMKDL